MLIDSGVIFGIDIAKGSSRAKELPRYAVAVLKEGEITQHKMVRLPHILKMVREEHPEYIAVDNIFELAPAKKELVRFLEKLPEGVRLVQVTGGLHKKSLLHLARENGLSFNQFDPNEEAETCARLASMGIGSEVSLFEDITKIKVSRARSLGRGGWSQNRYRRKVHGAVRERAREVEAILKKASKERGYSYDSRISKGFGGYVRAEFTVFAKRDQVPVGSGSTADAQVRVSSVVRDKIQYTSLKKLKRRPTIVGIDPGTTVGIAILSFEGELQLLKSIRGISHDEVVKLIAEYGKPAVVATDVTPTPGAVEKIRRSFNAVINTPSAEISSEEKIALGRLYGYSNDHERDSLAAALYAYRSYKNMFSRVEKKAPPHLDMDQIKLYVIQGASIGEAIEKVSGVPAPEKKPVEPPQVTDEDVEERKRKVAEKLKLKDSQISNLKDYVRELKKDLKAKDKRISKLELKLEKMREANHLEIRRDKEIEIRDHKISALKKDLRRSKKSLKRAHNDIRKLKQIRKMEIKGKGVPVKILPTFTREAILETKDRLGIKKGDIVFLEDASGGSTVTASMVVEMGVRAVITFSNVTYAAEDVFFRANMPLLKNVRIQRVDDLAVVDPDILQKALDEWEKQAEIKRQEEKEKKLKHLVDEYRSERRRGLA
ncbi:DUF460 domain-containing protein [Methanococcoides methylutens]|uniref:DUF460 domain-containing protein n=1 Tax=Methanococcoides methylutens MM1 TaxID=1434104 RepID=A0A0E3SRF2_METMT|nr:DUF460 domain-containing protein [Methanococcoides methylutens]AKB84767.1 hypothetical protein MCMEM_0714 [Methanococcoides methylutens MM1]